MLPPLHPKPRRSRTRWLCPACRAADRDAVLGELHPYRGSGTYLLITRSDVTVRGVTAARRWRIVCACGFETEYAGQEVRWERTALVA